MMTEREALKLALEAFEEIAWSNSTDWQRDRAKVAITAIKEALAQPEQEPVAWLIWLHGPAGHFDHKQFAELEFERRNKEYPDPERKLLPLYTTPPQPESVIDRSAAVRIATALGWEPKRKPLTEPELHSINPTWPAPGQEWGYEEVLSFARAIEAAHGIKE